MQARRPPAGLTGLVAGLCCLALLGSSLAGGTLKPPRRKAVLFPSDLGAETLDVSGYPERLQRIYSEILPKKCMSCHSLARAFNAPLVELDEHEEALERKAHPELFEPEILRSGPETWKIYIKRMFMRPPCCGSCGVWSMDDIRQVHDFLRYDSRVRKTGARAGDWIVLRKRLNKEYKEMQEKQLLVH
jgi:hypothetical protein